MVIIIVVIILFVDIVANEIVVILQSLSSDLVVAYMDDVALGGSEPTVSNIGPTYSLQLYTSKWNTAAVSHAVIADFDRKTTDSATLLSSPLSIGTTMTVCLAAHYAVLARAVERLKLVSAHDALFLLKNSLIAPRLLHTLRLACSVDQKF